MDEAETPQLPTNYDTVPSAKTKTSSKNEFRDLQHLEAEILAES